MYQCENTCYTLYVTILYNAYPNLFLPFFPDRKCTRLYMGLIRNVRFWVFVLWIIKNSLLKSFIFILFDMLKSNCQIQKALYILTRFLIKFIILFYLLCKHIIQRVTYMYGGISFCIDQYIVYLYSANLRNKKLDTYFEEKVKCFLVCCFLECIWHPNELLVWD